MGINKRSQVIIVDIIIGLILLSILIIPFSYQVNERHELFYTMDTLLAGKKTSKLFVQFRNSYKTCKRCGWIESGIDTPREFFGLLPILVQRFPFQAAVGLLDQNRSGYGQRQKKQQQRQT